MKIIYMSTPEFGVPILEALVKEHEVLAVVSQPDKKVGRKQIVTPTPVKSCALKHNLKVIQPINIRKEYQEIIDLNADIIITAAYGQILPEVLLNCTKHKAINVHGSLLPKLRGGAPIHKAITYGYDVTGVTIMYMAKKMDSGDIISTEEIKILDTDTVGTLHDKMQIVGRDLLLKTLVDIEEGNFTPRKQVESEVTYAWNISKEEERIDFTRTSKEVFDHIRGFNPWPVAYFKLENKRVKAFSSTYIIKKHNYKLGEVVSIDDTIDIATSDGIITLKEIQVEGKKRVNVKDFLNSNQSLFEYGKIVNE